MYSYNFQAKKTGWQWHYLKKHYLKKLFWILDISYTKASRVREYTNSTHFHFCQTTLWRWEKVESIRISDSQPYLDRNIAQWGILLELTKVHTHHTTSYAIYRAVAALAYQDQDQYQIRKRLSTSQPRLQEGSGSTLSLCTIDDAPIAPI